MKIFLWILFGFFAIGIGVYPFLYFITDMSQGFLSGKPGYLLQRSFWNFCFYQHIIFGGIALLSGWTQFIKKIRSRYLTTHRFTGKLYVISCLSSGLAGLYLAFFANGGLIASLGFAGLAISWIFTTSKAFLSIRQMKISEHEHWMIRSYALTFAAVTLRIWLPLSQMMQFDFITAYIIISWLCWVPNLIISELIVRHKT